MQELAEGAPGARDARHNGPDRDIEDHSDVFVLELFYFAEQECFAELRLKLFERGVESSLVVEAKEDVFGSGTGGGGVEGVGMVFEEDGAGGGDAGTRGEESIAEDAEDPGLEVGVVLEGVEGSEGFGVGLLHEVFGFGWIAGEPVGVVVERGEEGERELLEGCAAVDGRGHGAECLGRSEERSCGAAWPRRCGEEDRKGLGVQHPFR